MRIIETGDLTPETIARLGETHKLWVYNGLDCCLTHEIDTELDSVLDPISRRTYEMSLALQAPILEMNMRGVKVDLQARGEAIRLLSLDKAKLDHAFDYLCIHIFNQVVNPGSWQQTNKLFYQWLNLPEQKKRNSNGEYTATTDREALEKLGQLYYPAKPFVNLILKSRDVGKQIGTLETALSPDGRLKTSFSIAGTKTGRLASSMADFSDGTNLQNIDKRIRRIFIADDGYKLCNVDLEQADARNIGAMVWNLFPELMAKNSGVNYLDAAESGDLHTTVSKLCWRELPWPGDPRGDRELADQPFYREKSYRDLGKVLGHGCLTGDHEVLTPYGWVAISEKPEKIMQWGEQTSQFVEVTNWVDQPFTGELQAFDNHNIAALMTPEHRVPYKLDPTSGKIKTRSAQMGPGKFMPMGDGWIGGKEIVPARLIAALMCDGHQEPNWMAFHFHKGRKVDRLLALCEEYGYEYRIHGDKIRVKGRLPKYPGAFMFNWTAECLKDFILELRHWDGHIGKSAVSLHSSRREDLEWYQTFGRILGIGGNIQKPHTSGFGTQMWTLQQNNRRWMTGQSVKHTTQTVIDEPIYCPTVPSGWFYVRRQGRIFVTGNSNFNGKPPQMSKHTKTDQRVISDFQDRYFGAFPELKKRIEWVDNEIIAKGSITTLFGRRRYFLKRRGDNKTLNEGCAFEPQSMTAEEINYAMLKVFRLRKQFPLLQMLLQVHDSLLLQYPEEYETQGIIPAIQNAFKTVLELRNGRPFFVPCEVQVGWNWGYPEYDRVTKAVIGNPNGMIKYKGLDTRTRV